MRFISRDAVLSEHPYLYCEHEPVNSVDPSGNIPQWLKDGTNKAWEWLKEHGSAIAKGIGAVAATITGIKLAEEIYLVYVDWDCSKRMDRMWRDWLNSPGRRVDDSDIRWEDFDRLKKSHIRDAMQDISQAAGDIGKQIYRVRPQ